MTTWDDIYKSYVKGGDAYATLSRDINPFFKKFIEEKEFKLKRVLDIGCGDGRYLKLLQTAGFETDGIDSSKTAIELAKKALGEDSDIRCANMFEFDIPKGRYDLIISISTIYHGTKSQIQGLVDRIQEALAPSGKIFITLPSKDANNWIMTKKHEEIEPGTIVPLEGPERGLPHTLYMKEEVVKMFSKFSNVKIQYYDIQYYDTQWIAQADK